MYRFPYIRGVGIINRLKVYQTALSGFAIPITAVLHEANVINSDIVLATLGLSLSGCMFFYSLGTFTNKLIGNVYIHNETNKVRIAYLNFWGNRQDVILDINDITPYDKSRFPILSENLYKKYLTISSDEIFKINIKYGEVLDNERFNKVFCD